MSESEVIRLNTLLESLKDRFARHEHTVNEMLSEQNVILRDMAGQNAQFSHAVESIEALKTQSASLYTRQREFDRQLSNCETTIGTVKWVAGVLFTAILPALGAAIWHYMRAA